MTILAGKLDWLTGTQALEGRYWSKDEEKRNYHCSLLSVLQVNSDPNSWPHYTKMSGANSYQHSTSSRRCKAM